MSNKVWTNNKSWTVKTKKLAYNMAIITASALLLI
jgi:hypothetical protein